MSLQLIEWWGRDGDRVIAETAHVLCTPVTDLRAMPISLLIRMHNQAAKIARRGA